MPVRDLLGDEHALRRAAAVADDRFDDLLIGGAHRLHGIKTDQHGAGIGFVRQRRAHALGDDRKADALGDRDRLLGTVRHRLLGAGNPIGLEQLLGLDLVQRFAGRALAARARIFSRSALPLSDTTAGAATGAWAARRA